MWPGQINCGPGYEQPQRFPVFPSQDHTQQGIMMMNSQAKGDVFLAQPNATSQNVQMQTSKEQVMKIQNVHEPCYVTLSSGDSTSARISTQDGFTFEIIPNIVGERSRHLNNLQHIPLQYPQQGTNPSSQVQLDLNSGQQAHCANSSQQVQQHPNPSQQVQQCSNLSLQPQQGPNFNLQVQPGPNSSFQASSSRQHIPNIEDTVTCTSSHLDMSATGLGKTPFGMGNTANEMGDMPSATQNSNSAFNASRLQTVLTLQWLMENYETCDGYSVPRCVVYDQYNEFCASNSFNPLNPATFGKLIRQVFVNLKTRRLGIRGQSKYHYYGIRVKRTSELGRSNEHFTSEPKVPKHSTVPSKLMITDIDNTIKPDEPDKDSATEDSPVAGPVDRSLSPVTALGLALIPQFPKAFMLKTLPSIANLDEVDTFLTEYRTHCEYLLEAILKGKFSEIFSQMMIFWKNLSAQNLQLLKMESLAGTIKFCDILLYKTIISILIPGTTLEVPQSLLKAVKIFAKDFRSKLSKHIQKLPRKVFEAKNEAATSFVKLLVRKTTLSHIAQATRAILNNSWAVKMMRADWREKTDLENLRRKIDWLIVDVHIDGDRPDLYRYFQEFDALLEKTATVEQHVEWIDGLLKTFIEKTSEGKEKAMQNFLLYVSSISKLVLHDHTLRSASSFGSYHLLHMLYNEYILYAIEVNTMENSEQQLMIQQIGQEFCERYSAPHLEKAVSVIYSELKIGCEKTANKKVEPVRSPNTSGLCIVEDVDNDDDASVSTQSNGKLNATSGSSTIKPDENQGLPATSSNMIDIHASQLPAAVSEECNQEPKPLPLIYGDQANITLGGTTLTGYDSNLAFPVKHLNPHPQRVVIAGKPALVPPELMSKAPSYVAARVIKMQPMSGESCKTTAGQTKKICKVNLSPDQANNLFKGQLIDAEDGAQFIVNEVHKLPKRISTTAVTSPPTPSDISPAKVYHSL